MSYPPVDYTNFHFMAGAPGVRAAQARYAAIEASNTAQMGGTPFTDSGNDSSSACEPDRRTAAKRNPVHPKTKIDRPIAPLDWEAVKTGIAKREAAERRAILQEMDREEHARTLLQFSQSTR